MSGTHSIACNGTGSRAVASALRDSVDDIARALEPLLFPDGIPEDLDIPTLLGALADVLERGTESADAREPGAGAAGVRTWATGRAPGEGRERMAAEAGDEAPASQSCARATTDEPCEDPKQALRQALLRVRSLLGSVCGPQVPRRYKLDGRIPEEPEALLVFARRAARSLERAEPGAGQPAPFVTVDLAGAAACLRDHIDRLDMHLHTSGPGGRQPERTSQRSSRRQQTVTSIAEALLRLADERAAAKPARRHPRTARRDAQPAVERQRSEPSLFLP